VLRIAAAARDRSKAGQALGGRLGDDPLLTQSKLFGERVECPLEIAVEERLEPAVAACEDQRRWMV
jgi:hypothetical protein